MRVLDLFSGIGGFALAGQWVWGDDHEIVGFCEIDKYCHKVLNKNFPGVPIYEDIQQLNGKDFNDIDLITGGFPCQDISVAGKGAGIEEGTRSGLWFEMLRIISEVRPRFALIENVPMLTIRGGTRVIADLTKIGYDAEWTIIGADDVGAWHKRKRIWIVAYPNDKRLRTRIGRTNLNNKEKSRAGYNNRIRGRANVKRNNIKTSKNEKVELSNSNDNGWNKSRCKKVCCENDEWKNEKKIWRTCTDDLESQDSDGRTQGKSSINERLFIRGDDKKDKTTKSDKICELSKKSNNTKKTIRKNRNKKNNCGALVSQGQSRIQSPFDNRLGKNETSSKKNKIQQGNDLCGVYRMDNGKSKDELSNSKLRDVETRCKRCRGLCQESSRGRSSSDVTCLCKTVSNSNSRPRKAQHQERVLGKSNKEGKTERHSNANIQRRRERNTKQRVGGVANGLSDRLDRYWIREPEGIPRVATGQTKRVQRLKGLGNAIVPQVAYKVMKMIKECDE